MLPFLKETATFIESKRAYQREQEAYLKLLNEKLNAHNEVVHNLARKLSGEDVTYATIMQACKVTVDVTQLESASLTHLRFASPIAPEGYYGQTRPRWAVRHVPVSILSNDPVASAIHVRKQIRALREKATLKALEEAQKAAKAANTRTTNLQREQTEAENKVARLTQKLTQYRTP